MLHTLIPLPRANDLEDISDAIVGSVEAAVQGGTNMVMEIINKAVVPVILLILFVLILYFIAAFAYAKRQREGEGASRNIVGIAVCLVAFFLIAGFSNIFGALIQMFTGG